MTAERPQIVARSRFWWYASKWAVLLFSKLWFRVAQQGAENLPQEGAVLLVANHASYLDPPMVGITASREVNFLAQAGLASFAPLRWWLRQVGVTLIDRDAPSKEAMRLIGGCLKAGEVVGIFPEGTRSRDGSVMPFKSGVEFLVRRSKATVVPIGIDGTYRAFPRKAWFPRPRKVVVRFGEPWPAERVLADGGVEALRRRVAELARAPLGAAGRGRDAAASGTSDSSQAATVDPIEADPRSASSQHTADPTAQPSRPQTPVDGTA
ncbi:MAG: 1-acyl-sn-glycerol-3-phosphate acyltransferase [Planctomycetes bacterium]|nr:1-acyl-sn-glycerol-3-phosphate acyltransferase [Planctomycetota bacterium]